MPLFKKGMEPWNKGKKSSEETKKKMSESHKGKPSSMGMLGKNHSNETKNKMSLSHIGRKFSEEHKKKLKENNPHFWLGKQFSEETKRKISLSNKGRILSEEHKRNISKSIKGRRYPNLQGENNPNWKGGYERRLWNNRKRRNIKRNNGGSYTYEEWDLLKAQYNWTCPCCHKSEPEIKLTEDHIIPLSKGGSSNIENIQPLCKSCNCRKHTKIIKF